MNKSTDEPGPQKGSRAHEQAFEVFAGAIQLKDDERLAYLEVACKGDAALRAEVDSLLEHDDALNLAGAAPEGLLQKAILDEFSGEGDEGDHGSPEEDWGSCRVGDILGPYKLLQIIGEGGFGTVFAAEQERPIRRRIALKVLKAGMDTKEVIARFEGERHALGLMDHPNIARVYDAGATPAGRPFFVMEYVEGQSVTEFCNQEQLSVRARLQLFLGVCAAVQHAHQKGVIHRDLKPTNILVTLHEGQPVPKVIDFGIAKATNDSLDEHSVYTLQGQLLGTPEYMSPEQAEMSPVGVDSTTDIYSLGVVLYELLTGVLPFDPATLRRSSTAEMQRILREEEPKTPSKRVSTLGESIGKIGQQRHTDERRLRSDLSGDLDWIVMRAMEKQRTGRYPSASELAADIRRHLANEPVMAGPPSKAYRLHKFVRRNRAGVGFASVLFLLLVAGIFGTTRGMLAAERERVTAEENQKFADEESRRARAVTEFFLGTLGLANPDVTELPDMKMVDALYASAARVEEAFAEFPGSEAEVRLVIGRAFFTLGRPDLANEHLRQALFLQKEVLHSGDRDIVETLRVLWQVANRLGDSSWSGMVTEMTARRTRVIGETQPEIARRLAALDAMNTAPILADGAVGEAWSDLRRIVYEQVRPDDPAAELLAGALFVTPVRMGWRDPSMEWPEKIEQLLVDPLVPLSNATMSAMWESSLHLRMRAGDFAGARVRAERRLELLTQRLRADHWYLEIYRFILATCDLREREYEKALPVLKECLRVFEDSTAPQLWEAVSVRQSLAELYESTGRPELAEPFRRSLLVFMLGNDDGYYWPIMKAWPSPAYREVIEAFDGLDAVVMGCLMSGVPLRAQRENIEKACEELLEARRNCCPDEDPLSLIFARNIAMRSEIILLDGELDEAGEDLLREAHRIGALDWEFQGEPVQSWGRLLTAGMWYSHLKSRGEADQAAAVSRDIDRLVADDLSETDVWIDLHLLSANALIWNLVSASGLSPETYEVCARFSLDILDEAPNRSESLGAIGTALYRVGRYSEAILSFAEAEQVAASADTSVALDDLPGHAMAQFQVGHVAEAHRLLERLDRTIEGMDEPLTPLRGALIDEARSVIGSPR